MCFENVNIQKFVLIKDQIKISFLRSTLSDEGFFMSTDEVVHWLAEQNRKTHVQVSKIPLDQINGWSYRNGGIRHQSGNFFSIEGIHVRTNWGKINEWYQPIINQPEVGYLGFIAKEFNGVLHFLVQAKIEPGNMNSVQLSPTLQATRSNFSQIHKGKKPLYLEYFQQAKKNQILVDQLQSEQGARFLKKRNRNIIIQLSQDIPIHDNFIWLTIGQIKTLMRYPNLVNMDTRTVISGISVGTFSGEANLLLSKFEKLSKNDLHFSFLNSALKEDAGVNTIDDIITFLTQLKSTIDLEVSNVDLLKVKSWIKEDYQIRHETNKYFKVIGVDVQIGNREVFAWSQPMIEPAQEGICAFVCKVINGIMHFAVQAKLECGNHDIIEFAPTVQCLTGDFRETSEGSLPFLDYVLGASKEQVIFDTYQSEEGGRFYKEQNRNMIVQAGEDLNENLPSNYIWMTLHQLQTFLKFNNYLNIQARSLIAAITF